MLGDFPVVNLLRAVLRACALDSQGTATIFVWASGEVGLDPKLDAATKQCAQAVLKSRPQLAPGTDRSFVVDWARPGGSSAEVRLDYPIAKPSKLDDVTADFRGDSILAVSNLATTLREQLDSQGYPVIWFRFLDGFAVFTFPEKIDKATGTSICRTPAEKCQRFAVDFVGPRGGFFDWIRRGLGNRAPMTYRSFLFLVSREATILTGAAVPPVKSVDDLAGAYQSAGTTSIPTSARVQVTEDLALRAHLATYVFERAESSAVADLLVTTPYASPAHDVLRAHSLLPTPRKNSDGTP